jgi:hypothetical protein
MGKKQTLQKNNSPYWNTTQVKAMKSFLQSAEGQRTIQEVSERISKTERAINEMIIINPEQLREPFTI